jgi:hypothetical protein
METNLKRRPLLPHEIINIIRPDYKVNIRRQYCILDTKKILMQTLPADMFNVNKRQKI